MRTVLWSFQILLAFHAATGAVWKFINPLERVPSLSAIRPTMWVSLGVMEVVCTVFLLLPFFRPHFKGLASFAALFIAMEMVVFCFVHWVSGAHAPVLVAYWLVVAALASVFAYGRLKY